MFIEVVTIFIIIYLVNKFLLNNEKITQQMPKFIPQLTPQSSFQKIQDNYKNVKEVLDALRQSGLESSNLIIGVDYTSSNQYQGAKSFGGQNLHTIHSNFSNPYQRVISAIGRTLEHLDEDRIIPVFGFGDITTKNHSVFPILNPQGSYCVGVDEVLESYSKVTPFIKLSGTTNFAPMINKAIEIVTQNQRKEYHILLIITDGQVSETDEEETIQAIVKATNYPLSIIIVGVGDGPWNEMENFDDLLPQRRFDNLQFIEYNKVMKEDRDDEFALAAMMELPEQFKMIKKLKLL